MTGQSNRIVAREELSRLRDSHRDDRIVFTNGCFDLIHAGHISLLNRAGEEGDFLVVGVNSDDSVGRLKGGGRPLMKLEERLSILVALRPVDYVTVFEENTPLETIRALKPDVLVKGAEYEIDEIVGADVVEENGGKVIRVDMVEGRSTTAIINRIRESRVDSGDRSVDSK